MSRTKLDPPRNETEVVQCVQVTGSHFFDKDTMRAFGSRLHDPVYPAKFGTFFVTSEKDRAMTYSDGTHSRGAWDGRRRYTVRFVAARPVLSRYRGHVYANTRGQIVNVMPDDFGAFGTLDSARQYASKERHRLNGLLIKDKPVLFDSTPPEHDS
jgi:hypothetical protein